MTKTELRAKIENARKGGIDKKTSYGCGNGVIADITPKGFCNFYTRCKIQGKRKRVKLGSFPDMSLAQAVAQAEKIQNGELALSVKKRLFKDYIEPFLESVRANGRNDKRYKNLKSNFKHLSFLNEMKLGAVTPDIIEKKLRSNDLTQANNAVILGALNQFYTWCISRNYVVFNPCESLKKTKEFQRKRNNGYACVMPDEIKKAFFDKLVNVDQGLKCYFLVLALTAGRPGCVLNMRWDWIEENKINFPASVMKTNTPFICPISSTLKNVLSHLKEIQTEAGLKDSLYLFTRNGKAPCGVYVYQECIRSNIEHDTKTGAPVQSAHGLRKIFKTWCQQNGKSNDISEKQLAHINKNQLVEVYGKYDYFKERMELMEQYSDFIKSMLPAEFLCLCSK